MYFLNEIDFGFPFGAFLHPEIFFNKCLAWGALCTMCTASHATVQHKQGSPPPTGLGEGSELILKRKVRGH